MHKLKQKLFLLLFILVLLNPVFAMAQGSNTTSQAPITDKVDVPEYKDVQQSIENFLCTPSDSPDGRALEKCVNKVYRFGISFGAIALVFFLVYAGYVYISGGESAKGKAKEIVQNSLVGIALLLGSYVLLRFINPNLVIFKPIQPPIFSAPDFPDCEVAGLGEECILSEPGGGTIVGTGGYIACPDGLINFDKKIVQVNGGGDTEKICKSMWTKLVSINSAHKLIATATIGSGHLSSCHSGGSPKSGTCVDIVPADGSFPKLCQAVKSVGNVVIVNESGGSESDCGKRRHFSTTTGNHLHIFLTGSN